MTNLINSIWLTVNRDCNLLCKWCYGESKKNEEILNISKAIEIISFSKQIGTKNVILIGGEPTIYPMLHELVEVLKKQSLHTTIVTNGIRLADAEFLKALMSSGVNRFNISLKAENSDEYKKLCGIDCFSDIIKAMNNLNESNCAHGVSLVINKYNYYKLYAVVDEIRSVYDGVLQLSFCMPTFDSNGYNVQDDCSILPLEYVESFQEQYNYIDKATNGKLMLHQNLPLCLWSKEIINSMKNKNQIWSTCHIYNRNGLIFDHQGKILMCNMLSEFPIGTFGVDFFDRDSFYLFWNDNRQSNLYNKLTSTPSKKCITCVDYTNCGSGCAMQWFKYTYEEIGGKK